VVEHESGEQAEQTQAGKEPPAQQLPAEQTPLETGKKNTEERKALLAQAVANWVHGGWRVESQTDFQAVMAKGHRPNHILHLILTIITVGVWAIVWILVTVLGGEKRAVVSVDEYGNTLAQR
jgi:hypothetical protein